jgi:hypothetical protein
LQKKLKELGELEEGIEIPEFMISILNIEWTI